LFNIAKDANGKLVGLEYKFKSAESLNDKVARDVHEANLKLLEDMEHKRKADTTLTTVKDLHNVQRHKLRERNKSIITDAATKQAMEEAVRLAREEAEKVADDITDKEHAAAKDFEERVHNEACKQVDMSKIVWSISDALRYTVLIDTENYTDAVRNAMQRLEAAGMTPASLKNYWGEGDG
jgi:DNA repair ATPase RecN